MNLVTAVWKYSPKSVVGYLLPGSEPPWIHYVSIDLPKYLQTGSMKNIYFFGISSLHIDLIVNKK